MAGELSDHFLSKPTMSALFGSPGRWPCRCGEERPGRAHRLKMSVLEDALLVFAEVFGLEMAADPGHERGSPS
jgi:hypothetical protein